METFIFFAQTAFYLTGILGLGVMFSIHFIQTATWETYVLHTCIVGVGYLIFFSKKGKPVIDKFDGEYQFLSNFYPVHIYWEGIVYPSVEHAFVAAKTLNMEERHMIANILSPGKAKNYGRTLQLREDWEQVKLGIMELLLRRKFDPENVLASKLKATGDAILMEGNTWGDTFWGVCKGKGQNHLGKLLMKIRSELTAGT